MVAAFPDMPILLSQTWDRQYKKDITINAHATIIIYGHMSLLMSNLVFYISFGLRIQNYRAIEKELPVSHVDINIKISASWSTKLGKQNYTNTYMINIIHTTKLSSVCSSFATTARRAQAVNWFFCRLLKHCKKILDNITNRIPFKISIS